MKRSWLEVTASGSSTILRAVSEPEITDEKQVGRIRIVSQAPAEASAAYRERGEATVVVERLGDGAPARRASPVVLAVIGILNVGLVGFAWYVRSWPAVGGVTVVLIAFVLFFLSVHRGGRRPRAKVVVGDQLRARGLAARSVHVSDVGVGVGDTASRTVWVSLPSGRELVLEELTAAEANAAADAIREAIERRKRAALAPTGPDVQTSAV